MSVKSTPVSVRSYETLLDFEQRHDPRHECALDATTRPLEAQDAFGWGASVRDISAKGIGLSLCYPFRAGTYLAVDLAGKNTHSASATILTRVVHAREQPDGSWHLGCEFVQPLTQLELETLL
jgi:hypothetical protein